MILELMSKVTVVKQTDWRLWLAIGSTNGEEGISPEKHHGRGLSYRGLQITNLRTGLRIITVEGKERELQWVVKL
jgi:hypothetical protein